MLRGNVHKFEYLIIPEEKIVLEYYSGDLGLGDIINAKTKLCDDESHDPTYSIIEDFRNARLHFSRNDVVGYVNFIKYHSKLYGKRKTAFLTETPTETALASLLGLYKGNLPIDPNIFCTLDSALKWLDIGMDKVNYIGALLHSLRA